MASPAKNQIWPLETTERKISNEIIANFSIVYRIFLRGRRSGQNEGKWRISLHFLRGGDAEDSQAAGDHISQTIQKQQAGQCQLPIPGHDTVLFVIAVKN
jgi:hypothetical protein